jgi:hypothetical protein
LDEPSSLRLLGVWSPFGCTIVLTSVEAGVGGTEGVSPDFVELAGVGMNPLVDRRGGMLADIVLY